MLDKSKPYGEVFGGGRGRYIQDGKEYDVFGREIADVGMQSHEDAALYEVNVIETDLPEQVTPENTRKRKPRR
jgi:hypothetical protein